MSQPAERAYYRFLVLFFNCLMTFGSYFCFDIPSVLQEQFQGNLTCLNANVTNGTTDCVEGLGMTPQQYNLLYAIYAWTNALVVILAGFFIDKLGNRVGVLLFSFLIVLGSATFALGSHFKGTRYLLPLMLIGRLLFGSSNGSLMRIFRILALLVRTAIICTTVLLKMTVNLLGVQGYKVLEKLNWSGSIWGGNGQVTFQIRTVPQILSVAQDRIVAFWFKRQELAMAFGLMAAFSRFGSVLNFLLTQSLEARFGIQWTLWGGTLLCVLSFVSAIIVGILDANGAKQLGLDGVLQQESKKVKLQYICHLSLRYWLLVLTIMFFYNGIFPFIADASKFIQDKYPGYSQQEASYITGAVFDTSLILLPLAGILIDHVGLRGIFVTMCAVLTVPVSALLAFTFVSPLVSMIWLGVTYSFAVASLWPSIILVVPLANLGTASGVATSVQMIGIGVCNLIVGQILGSKTSDVKIPVWRWQQIMIFMLANTICCVVVSILLNIVDSRQDNILNKTTKHSEATKEENQEPSETSPLLTDSSNENKIN